jgi:hypothetical protein
VVELSQNYLVNQFPGIARLMVHESFVIGDKALSNYPQSDYDEVFDVQLQLSQFKASVLALEQIKNRVGL